MSVVVGANNNYMISIDNDQKDETYSSMSQNYLFIFFKLNIRPKKLKENKHTPAWTDRRG